MKVTLFTFLFLCMSLCAFAQEDEEMTSPWEDRDTSTLQTFHSFHLSPFFLSTKWNVSYNMERPFQDNSDFLFEVRAGLSVFDFSQYLVMDIVFPGLTAYFGAKYYYNIAKRKQLNKNTRLNAGNYIAFGGEFVLGLSHYSLKGSDIGDIQPSTSMMLPIRWGFRRAFTRSSMFYIQFETGVAIPMFRYDITDAKLYSTQSILDKQYPNGLKNIGVITLEWKIGYVIAPRKNFNRAKHLYTNEDDEYSIH